VRQLQGGVFFGGVAAVLLAAQPVWAAATQVKAVRLNPANGGLNVVLETSRGDRPQIFTSSRGNTLVADIINTQLRLTGGNSFRQNSPAPGIASVEITQLDPNSIRMVVTGTTSTPTSQPVQRTAQGLTLNISSGGARAANSHPHQQILQQ
jgi:type IV pilus assembly protein PilQ